MCVGEGTGQSPVPTEPHCQGPFKEGSPSDENPSGQQWGWESHVKVGVKGKDLWEKRTKKPTDLFVGDDCAAQQEGQN